MATASNVYSLYSNTYFQSWTMPALLARENAILYSRVHLNGKKLKIFAKIYHTTIAMQLWLLFGIRQIQT